MTRREKLRAIFAAAVAQGITTQGLLDRIEAFSAGGGSGIELFLDEVYSALYSSTPVEDPCVDQKEAVYDAQAAIEDALGALSDALSTLNEAI